MSQDKRVLTEHPKAKRIAWYLNQAKNAPGLDLSESAETLLKKYQLIGEHDVVRNSGLNIAVLRPATAEEVLKHRKPTFSGSLGLAMNSMVENDGIIPLTAAECIWFFNEVVVPNRESWRGCSAFFVTDSVSHYNYGQCTFAVLPVGENQYPVFSIWKKNDMTHPYECRLIFGTRHLRLVEKIKMMEEQPTT